MDIQQVLPHRFPFLFIDRVLEIEEGKRVVAIKNVSYDEPVFQGHFPGLPLFPGVLQLECMAQAGGLCVGAGIADEGRIGVLAGIERARFYRPVRPGDQLRIEAEIVGLRRGFGKAQAKILCEGESVAQATITFALRSREEFQQAPR